MKCRICESVIDFYYINDEHLREVQMCFFCDFWWEKVTWHAAGDVTPEGYRIARVKGNHYTILPDGSTAFLGFGGRKHVVRFYGTGEKITTHNLWHQGEIPQRFREHLPNNAVFVDTRLTCKCRAKFEPITETQTMCLTCVMGMKPQRW